VSRVVGILAATALALALPVGAPASESSGAHFDFGPQLMMRLFGETSDSVASFEATQGDRASESPLRDLALRIAPDGTKSAIATARAPFATERFAVAQLSADRLPGFAAPAQLESTVRFTPSALGADAVTLSSADHFMAAYQPVPPQTTVSPAPGTVAFAVPQMRASDYAPPTTQIGAVRFQGNDEQTPADTPQASLRDTSAGAGANFDVRAGKRTVNLNLSSEYEHVGRNDANAFSVATLNSASSWQLPGGTPLVVPGYADLNRLSLGAGFSVPVTHGLTLNLNYDAQHLYGGYGGLPGLMNLDTVDASYGGKLTLNIPRISSSLSISAYQDRFAENLLPLNGATQTREDVNFTVKF
jgi:hypothetical protein